MEGRTRTVTGRAVGAALATSVALVLAGRTLAAPPMPDGRPDATHREQHAVPQDRLYKSPINLLPDRSGRRLFVACEGTGEVLVVDTGRQRVAGAVSVGEEPFGLALSPDETRLYVGSRWRSDVAVVDLEGMRVERRLRVGDDPHHLALTPDGRQLLVTNLSANTLSVMDACSGQEVRTVLVGAAPFGLATSPDGGALYVSSQYSLPVPFRTPPVLELTVVDVDSQYVRERRTLPSAVIGQGVAVTPDGSFVLTALEIPKNLVPETQVYQGWMVTYGIAVTETRPRGRTAYLLIDEPNLYYADPFSLALTPDGRFLYVSSSGADVVTVIDLTRAWAVLQVAEGRIGLSDEQIAELARHLAASNEYVVGRISTGSTGANPKGLAISPDGRRVWVANRLADEIGVIDTRRQELVGAIDLGGPRETTLLRAGARLFNYASISFQKQMSCATCHPENGVDGLVYDIAADGGMGHNLVDNMTMRGLARTAPFKWTGKNPTLARQEGPRAAQLFFRTHGFEPEENRAIVAFIESLSPRPNRYRRQDGQLTETQEHGLRLFRRAYDNLGRYVPVANRCVSCHPQPRGTDRRVHDVATRAYHDREGRFDTPHLQNLHERVPYLHDGRAYSLEQIWTENNPDDTHGVTNEMAKDQLNMLIEYIKTF
ncbi:MAG: hypothetical protein AB1505_01310 [Candidatus Latescibacterota bacterium]